MTRFVFGFLMICFCFPGYGQVVKDTMKPSFEWNILLVDFPFQRDAAQAESNHRKQSSPLHPTAIKVKDYADFYRTLSMGQVTDMTRNVHGTLYYINNKLWNNWMPPTSNRKYLLNRVLANITALGTDYLATKIPYNYAFQHEEFHRSVISTRGIYSYDGVWKFGKGMPEVQ